MSLRIVAPATDNDLVRHPAIGASGKFEIHPKRRRLDDNLSGRPGERNDRRRDGKERRGPRARFPMKTMSHRSVTSSRGRCPDRLITFGCRK
jgi:hypothetical protein